MTCDAKCVQYFSGIFTTYLKSSIYTTVHLLFISSSSSTPFNRRWHCVGKASWMRIHSSVFTNVFFLPLSLVQVETRFRQRGQHILALSTVSRKQGLQNVCVHGSVTGSRKISRQMGHKQSARLSFPSCSNSGSSSETGGITPLSSLWMQVSLSLCFQSRKLLKQRTCNSQHKFPELFKTTTRL